MVERVIGRVDQVEIIFEHADGDQWNVKIPADKDCTYILELYAIDEAGNESYISKIFFEYDRSLKTVIIKPIPYTAMRIDKEYFGLRIVNDKEVGGCLK